MSVSEELANRPENSLLIKLDEFAPVITIEGPDGKNHRVATTPAANKAIAQVTAARLRSIFDGYLTEIEISRRVPDAKELKILMEAGKTIEVIASMAYGTSGKMAKTSEFENFALRAVKMAASGAASTDRYEQRRKRLNALGRKAEEAKPVEMIVIEPSAEPPSDAATG